jgi:hypothetical protein
MQLSQVLQSNDAQMHYQYEKYSRNNHLKSENYDIIKHIIDHSKSPLQDLSTIANKHGLIKENISKLVQYILDTKAPNREQLLELYELTKDKIYLEGQFAKIVLQLSTTDPNKLLDVNIDTIQLDRYEKLVFILHQFQALLQSQQYQKIDLLAKKVNQNVLKDYPKERIQYHHYLIDYYKHTNQYERLGDTFMDLYRLAPSPDALQNTFYLFLTDYSMEQHLKFQQLIQWDHPLKPYLKQLVQHELVSKIPFEHAETAYFVHCHVVHAHVEYSLHFKVLYANVFAAFGCHVAVAARSIRDDYV